MPKRHHVDETDSERWRRKMLKYEKKLAKKKSRIVYSSEDEDKLVQPQDQSDIFIEETISEQPECSIQHEDGLGTNNTVAQYMAALDEQSAPAAAPSEAPAPPVVPEVDPELLQALGDCHTDVPEWGDHILQDISQRWEPILVAGLKKEVKDDLLKKYLLPLNVPSSKAPSLNPEISAMLTESCRNRDARLCTKQNQLGRAIAALGKAMTGILTKNMDPSEVLKILNDAGKLMADSHYLETDTRRSLIVPLLDKSYMTPFKDRKRDKFLFGENLGEFIKSSRGIKKTGQLLTPPVTSTSTASTNLNWRGPPRQTRPGRTGASRGGQRAPPPPARRAPLPPAPPRRALPAPSSGKRPPGQPTSRFRNTT